LFKKIIPPFLAGLSACLFLIAIWGGLYRIGWTIPVFFPGLPGIHGPLIVCGFLGVMFSMERASAAKKKYAYVTPLTIGAGAVSLLFSPMGRLPQLLVLLGSLGFLWECGLLFSRGRNLFNLFYFLGSTLWVAGMVVWMARWPVFYVYLWWMGFVLFVLLGQRLEIARRIQMHESPEWLLAGALALVFFGMLLMAYCHMRLPEAAMEIKGEAIFDPRIVFGMRSAGVGMVLSALWLIRYDASRRLIGSGGISTYTGVCLVSAYCWLAVSGTMSFLYAGNASGAHYDSLLHSFFIGFDWFVIFGHAPMLAFSQFGVRLKKITPLFFYLFFLHAALAVRLVGGILNLYDVKKWGGMLNGVIFILFFAHLGAMVFLTWRRRYETQTIGG
jgi:hypothetical protein